MDRARSTSGRSLNILKFPQDIEAVPHKMLINVRSRNRAGAGELTTTVGSSVRSAIALPVPGKIIEKYNANYDNADLGVIGNAIADAMTEVNLGEGLGAAIGSLGAAAGTGLRRLAGLDNETGMNIFTTGARNVAGALAYGAAINLTNRAAGYLGQNTNTAQAIAAGTGMIFNPHQTAVFKGVNLRTMVYTWSLAPKTEQESINVEKIVDTLRYAMLPSIARNRLFLNFPDEIEYKILGSLPQYDMPTTPCVITDIALDRSPQGPSFFAKTGAPVLYGLTITLMEIKSLLKEDFADRRGSYENPTPTLASAVNEAEASNATAVPAPDPAAAFPGSSDPGAFGLAGPP